MLSVKINGTLVEKQKHLLQISVQELHNDIILLISEDGFFGARTDDRKVCIRKTSKPEAYTRLTSQCFYKC